MSGSNELALVALLTKRLVDLGKAFKVLAKEPGPKGDKGDRGDAGPPGPAPKHEWQGTKLRFQHPGGRWGKWTDLEGASGGVYVSGGSRGGIDLSTLPAATGATPTGFVVRQGASLALASFAQMAEWFGGTGAVVTVRGETVTVRGATVRVS